MIWTDVNGGLFLSRNSDRVFPLIEKADASVLHIWQNVPGAGWVISGEQSIRDLAFSPDFAADRTVFALADNVVIVSRNGGVSWQPLCYESQEAAPAGTIRLDHLAVSPNFNTDKTVYVGGTGPRLLVSYDSGLSWTVVSLR